MHPPFSHFTQSLVEPNIDVQDLLGDDNSDDDDDNDGKVCILFRALCIGVDILL